MRTSFLLTLLLSTLTITTAAPSPNYPNEKREPRPQADISQLLQLASYAGVTLPADPAVLLSLGPIAQYLASELPTAPVLSVLVTAAPSGFLSEILHDPAYASSFESAFAAGTPPGWFQSLPTEVKSYLHTYSDYGGVATAAAEVGVLVNATTTSSGRSVAATTGSVLSSALSGGVAGSSTGSGSMSTTSAPSTTSGAAAGGASSSTSQALAPRETGLLGLGIAGVVGILGLAVAL
ncbi:hypothetical protein MMC30_000981 [Trapelia coarctata]|nr:hypothetical protein [Trapelia coarctata]